MGTPWQTAMLGADGWPEGDGLASVLEPRFSPAADGGWRRARRTWLDTFDWRLHRAGLTLEVRSARDGGELVLTARDGGRVSFPAGVTHWPAPTSVLPPGPLADQVSGVAGIRALLPVARAASETRRFRMLDANGKTVTWLTLERVRAAGRGAPAPAPARTWLTLTPVRGYRAQADRISALLLSAPEVSAERLTPLEAVLAAAGRHPGDYTGRVEVTLDATAPAQLAMGQVLLHLLGTLEANVHGTLRDIDTEFLHDLRVAVRRTRSGLKLAGDVLPEGLAVRFRGEFKWLGDATTPTRDLDVYLLHYPEMAAGLVAAEPADLEPFRALLAGQRETERRRLARALRSARFAALTSSWRAELTGLRPPPGGRTAAGLAADRIRRAHRQVLARGGALTPDSPPESLHDLRKRCKELRYALEFFASLHDPASHEQALRDLKKLQDCLGAFQDCEVQATQIAMSATRLRQDPAVSAATLLAMGELAGQVALRKRAARDEFAGRFARFTSPASRRLFRALTTGGGS